MTFDEWYADAGARRRAREGAVATDEAPAQEEAEPFVIEPAVRLFRRREIKRLELYRYLVRRGTFNEGFEGEGAGATHDNQEA